MSSPLCAATQAGGARRVKLHSGGAHRLGRAPWQRRRRNPTCSSSGAQILHDEARALDALADSLGEQFEQAVELILDCKGKLIVSGLGKSGHVGRKIAATFASTGTTATFLHLAEAIHGDLGMAAQGRRRDPHLAKRRDRRAGAGDRPFRSASASRSSPSPAIRGSMLGEAAAGAAGPAALARSRAGSGRADDLDDDDPGARRCAGDDGDARRRASPAPISAGCIPGGSLGARLKPVRRLMHGGDAAAADGADSSDARRDRRNVAPSGSAWSA